MTEQRATICQHFWGQRRRGFTLLEVLIALAILAGALAVLMGTVANSSQQAVYSNQLTRVGLLAQSKMTDLEYELYEEGFSDHVENFRGNFREEGYPEITWEADIHPVEIPPGVEEELLGQVNAQLFGGQDAKGALRGNAAFSSKLPMLVSMVPMMINQIGNKTRRVRLTVHYEFAGSPRDLTVSQYVIDEDSAAFDLFEVASDFADFGDLGDLGGL